MLNSRPNVNHNCIIVYPAHLRQGVAQKRQTLFKPSESLVKATLRVIT